MCAFIFRFEEGFKTLGFLDELRAHPEIFEDLFTNVLQPLEAKDLSTLFEVDFSAPGSNRRRLENQIICFWRDWLIDVEGMIFYWRIITSCSLRYR